MNIKITGVKEVDKALATLEKALARKVIRQSMRSGLAPMLARAKELAPVGVSRLWKGKQHEAGTLRKNIKIRAAKVKGRGTIAARVAASMKDYAGDLFYGSFPEYGTKRQRAQYYMKRAFDATKTAVVALTIGKIREGINANSNWWHKV